MTTSLISFSRYNQTTKTGGINYYMNPFGGDGNVHAEVGITMPFAAVLTALRVAASGVFSSTGTVTTAHTVRVNGSSSALTCTISATASPYAGSDAHDVSVAVGDVVSVAYIHSAGVQSSPLVVATSITVAPVSGTRHVLLWGTSGASPSASTRYMMEFSYNSYVSSETYQLVPFAGTLRNLYITARTNPTGSGSVTYKIRKNGVDTALAVTIAHNASPHAGNNIADEVSVAANDRISLQVTRTQLPSSNGADYLAAVEYQT